MGKINQAKNVLAKVKAWGIVVSILLVAAGVVALCFPIASELVFKLAIMVGFVVAGIFNIVRYAKQPKDEKQGVTLALGILQFVCGALMLVSFLHAPLRTAVSFDQFIGFLIGFYAVFTGISMLCSSGVVKASGGSMAWSIVGGILCLIAGLLILAAPFWSVLALEVFLGVYLIIMGICLFIEVCTSKSAKEIAKDVNEVVEPVEEAFEGKNDDSTPKA